MEILEKISYYILPFILLSVALIILFGKKDYFDSFLRGAAGGAKSAVGLLPTLCALIVGVSMLTASGAGELICQLISPLFDKIGIPKEIFPLLLTRPISGSASLATFGELLSQTGADSFPALCASLIMASSDTFIYVICVYFSQVKIRKTRHALPVAVFVSCLAVFLSCILCRLFY
ncbi:MAG: spore maturation protein [Clostridia bacterium]|nr:spore maturation protein [Clostridia bacterium]